MINVAFHYITKKLINLNNNPFSKNYDKSDNVPPMVKIFFNHFINYPSFYQDKFYFFNETKKNAFFLTVSKKSQFLLYFCKIQRTYFSFQRLAYLWKYKKAKIVVNTDMALNEINENQKNVMCIFHNGSKYLFRIQDLIQIIDAGLTHSYNFFAEPMQIKNPFNNLPFSKSTLYNIYFYIKFNTRLYPELLIKFFQVNFDLSYFLYYNEPLLREYAIKNYTTKSPSSILYNEIFRMLEKYNGQYKKEENKILIDPDFPKERLIKIMKPYILLYFNSIYSLTHIIKEQSKKELICKLNMFQKFNPQFGKKKIVFNYIRDGEEVQNFARVHIDFSEQHISFQDTTDFATSHLEVNNSKIIYPEGNMSMFNTLLHPTYDTSEETSEDTSDYEDELYENVVVPVYPLIGNDNYDEDTDSVS